MLKSLRRRRQIGHCRLRGAEHSSRWRAIVVYSSHPHCPSRGIEKRVCSFRNLDFSAVYSFGTELAIDVAWSVTTAAQIDAVNQN